MKYSLLGGSLCLVACAAESPAVTAPTAVASPVVDAAIAEASIAVVDSPDVAPLDAGSKKTTACQLPPFEMVKENIGATAMSGIAEILTSTSTGLDGKAPAPKTGYINFRYTVRVLRWFSGKGPEQIVLSQGAEAPNTPPPAGQLLFFMACSSANGSGYEPDVGYFFPLDPTCRSDAEALGTTAASKAGPTKRKPRACDTK